MTNNTERIQEIRERLQTLVDFGHKIHKNQGELFAEREMLEDELSFLQGMVPPWLVVEDVWEDGPL